MSVREIQFTTNAEYEALAAVMNAIWPELPMTASVLRKQADESRNAGLVRRHYGVEQDGTIVGVGSFGQPTDYWFQQPGRFEMNFGVKLAYRRRGFGAALFERMMADLGAYHPAEVFSFTTEDRLDGMQFLERHGFQEAMRSCESVLDIPLFDESRFVDALESMQTMGIELRSFTELASDPERDAKLYALDSALLQDVPTPGEQPAEYTLDDWRKKHSAQNPDFLPEGLVVAIHDGRYIGLSELSTRGDTNMLGTGLTGVLPDYRRKGIALALKVRALTYAKTLGKRRIITYNEVHNPMYALNVKLGFLKNPDVIVYVKRW